MPRLMNPWLGDYGGRGHVIEGAIATLEAARGLRSHHRGRKVKRRLAGPLLELFHASSLVVGFPHRAGVPWRGRKKEPLSPLIR